VIQEIFEGVYTVQIEGYGEQLATRNLVPGVKAYGERLLKHGSIELRVWDPFRSKLAAALKKELKLLPLKKESRVLYLGAAAGTTVSHVSDIVDEKGVVFAVEFSARSMRELMIVCEPRKNVIPILADARFPLSYRGYVDSVDVLYVDVAQPDQAQIAVENSKYYLKKNGWVLLSVKSRSVDVAAEPSKVYAQQKAVLIENGFEITCETNLSPYEKDHEFVVAKAGS
jgi:fibrillarin-like pre-rRNA processing protein